jgi:Family of unknown function (DUF6527)
MGIPLRIAEPTGRYRRSLRRFTYSSRNYPDSVCPATNWGHDASVVIGEILEEEADVHGDNWAHSDPRWPMTCEACNRPFPAEAEWQRNDCPIFRRPDGVEFINWGSPKDIPPGTMIRVPWYDGHGKRELKLGELNEAWQVWLPDGGTWITTQEASGGGYWTVTGTPPLITVSPSIFHNQPDGWHGFIRNGQLEPA